MEDPMSFEILFSNGLVKVALAIGILVVARLLSAFVMYILRHSKILTERTQTTLDDTVIGLLTRPIHIAFQLAAIIIALYYLFPDLSYQGFGYLDLSLITVILWGGYAVNRLARGIMHWYEEENAEEAEGPVKRGAFGFLYTLISVLVWGIALSFALNQVGVDISALLAGLGIAGVAIAFALQNTLSGVFSAVYLAIDRPIRPADYVKLSDGTEGFVEDISLRSTRIRTFENNLVIVPNNKLADMVITNYYMPDKEVGVSLEVGVAYGSDLEKVEKTLLGQAEAVLKKFDAAGDSDPFVRFKAFDDSAIQAKLYVRINAFMDQFFVKHELMKAIKVAFEKEGIEIPFPQVDVHQKN